MKWFDKTEVKDKAGLSEKEMEYLYKPSFSVFGPLNMIVRGHWDFIAAIVGLNIITWLMGDEETVASSILALIILGFYAWFLYFQITNSRRLSWNRNKWSSFEDFKDSENRWAFWGYLVFSLIILTLAASFIQGFLEA
ncbi:hypothetical protein M0R36_10650 [bacterium]|jgi:hypothetical protein|nr:hypothetical protein [bacterium]HOF50583.1 hypothetical protein [Candidatus Colwellbacteria bacterium]